MKNFISKTNILKFNKEFKNCSTCKISRNALTRSNINDIAMDENNPSEIEFLVADINSDGVVDVLDIIILVNSILGDWT